MEEPPGVGDKKILREVRTFFRRQWKPIEKRFKQELIFISCTRLAVGDVQALVFTANYLSFYDERQRKATAVANS